MGMFVAVFAVASVVGPLLGGVLSGASSINLAFLSSLTPRLLQTTSAGDGVSVSTVPTVGKSASSHVWGSLGINLPVRLTLLRSNLRLTSSKYVVRWTCHSASPLGTPQHPCSSEIRQNHTPKVDWNRLDRRGPESRNGDLPFTLLTMGRE